MDDLTASERLVIVTALRFESDCYLGKVYPLPTVGQWQADAAKMRLDLADRIEAARG